MAGHAPLAKSPAIAPQERRAAGHASAVKTARPLAAAGNQALQSLFASGTLRAKLRVGAADDPEEREADRVAGQVVAGGAACTCSPGRATPCPACAAKSGATVRRRARRDARHDGGDVSNLSLGSGRPLAMGERSLFEPRIGAELGDVRVHTDGTAAQAAESIGARAFSLGNRIAFGQGEYRPQSTEGRLLLAHELAHVTQGHAGIRRWEEGEAAPAPPAGQTQIDPLFQQFLQGQGGAGSGQAGPMWPTNFPRTADPFASAHSAEVPRAPVCPGPCHQIAESHRRYAQQRMAAAERQRRLEAWPGMHQQQHPQEIAQQARTLPEDISQSELTTAQMRMQLFDAASGPGASRIGAGMRESWATAFQATLFLESTFRQEDARIPEDLLEPLRTAYRNYFTGVTQAMRDRDRDERRFLQEFERPAPCPNCHRPNEPAFPRSSPIYGGNLLPQPSQPSGEMAALLAGFSPTPPATREAAEPEPIGPREERLVQAGNLAASAADRAQWRQVIAHFRWATAEMDAVLVAAVPRTGTNRDLLDQFEYTRALLDRQREFLLRHPDAIKVRAVFYPEPRSVADLRQRPTEAGTEDFAAGIPWQFYMTRTAGAEGGEDFPVDFEWLLHDITAARRDDRTVKVTQHVGNLERNIRALGAHSQTVPHPPSMWQTDPDPELFLKLDHKDFFPEGQLYYEYPSFQYPGRRRSGTVRTNASRTFWEWVRDIGMGVAILGSLIFAPFSTPMLIAVAAGTGLSIFGGYMRLQEMEEHGVATERDVNQFYWGLTLDILSALTLGVGRVAAVAARTGQAARAASAGRVWFVLQRTELAASAVNVGVTAYDFLQQYQAIEASNLDPEQKREALRQLTMSGLIVGAISIVPVAIGVRDLRRGATLHLVPDPQNPGRNVARFDPGAAEELQIVGRREPAPNARALGSIPGTGANRGHHYGVWSDGRITRCSTTPCPDVAASVLERMAPLRARMLPQSAHAERVHELAEEARRLHLDAATASPEALRTGMADFQLRAKSLDDRMAALERDVGAESLAALRSRLTDTGELDLLMARRLPEEAKAGINDVLARVARSGDFDAERLARMVTVMRSMDPSDLARFMATRVQINRGSGNRIFHTPESLWWGRLREFEEVSMLEAQIRGYAPSLGAPRSARGAGIPGATLVEASTPRGEHGITSLIGDPMPRQGLENVLPSRGQVRDPALRQSMDIMVAERLHAVGAGLGAETGTGVAAGSSFINQFLQNRGVEDLMRFLHRNRPPGVRYVVHVDVRTVRAGRGGETELLQRITYRVRAVEELPNGGLRPLRDMFEGTITHPRVIRAATRPRGRGDIQGIGLEVEPQFGALAEHFGL